MAISPRLGLHTSPDKVTYIFVGEAEGDEGPTPWYEWDHDHNKPIPIKDDAITGYINNITITKKNFKGKDNYKLDIHISADKKYVIRAGAGTVFSRGFVLCLETLIAAEGRIMLEYPLTISISPGEGKAMFCGLWDLSSDLKIIPKWDGESALAPKIAKLQAQLEQVVQTKEMIDNPELYKEAVKKLKEQKGDTNAKNANQSGPGSN